MRRRRIWADLPLGVKGLIVIAIPLLSLIAATLLSYFLTREQTGKQAFVASYLQRVHSDVQRVLFLVQDAETGVRSYLLTEEPPFLRRYHAAQRELPPLLESLEEKRLDLLRDDLGFDDPQADGSRDLLRSLPNLSSLGSDLAEIDRLVPERLETLEQLVDLGDAALPAGEPGVELTDMLTGRVELIQTLNHTSKHIQPQLLELANRAADEQAADREDRLRLVLLIAALGLVGGVGAIVLFTRTITRRVGLLESAAGALAEERPLSSLPAGRDAIGRLAVRFEETSELLALRGERLRDAKDEAERADRAKSDFLSRMSHELRTPLNGILGFGQLLQMEGLKPRQKNDLDQIMKAGRHLLDLINEVLDIASVESGRLTLSIEPVRVEEVVADAVALVSPIAAERGVMVAAQEIDDLYAAGDRQRLKQVLLNLLSNAVKYNSDGGTVEVVATADADVVSIAVIDTGRGIAEDRLDRLFVPFDRLDAEQSEGEGTGLGLALSLRLVEAMQGRIEIESMPGKGSTFRVVLPRSAATAARAELPVPAMNDAVVSDGSPRSLLYIEDNLANLELVEQILAHRPQFSLQSAMQGGLGIDLASQHAFDAILLDLDLPDMKGTEVLRRLRGQAGSEDVPVIVVTADASPGQAERLLDQGAAAYVSKPLDVNEFLRVVDEVLGRATLT
ncbi:MAG: hypothetical protein QOH26_293 [Actinomycetota bacterium]|nr:hypothetical protein [Actinomycetota bacterium]